MLIKNPPRFIILRMGKNRENDGEKIRFAGVLETLRRLPEEETIGKCRFKGDRLYIRMPSGRVRVLDISEKDKGRL